MRNAEHIAEVWRYYKAGVINTLFGVGLYFALVYLGLNLYVAQIVSHVTGVIFNYYMFTRHVFRDHKPNKLSYIGSYGVNYLFGLGFLAFYHSFFPSPYLAGFLTVVTTSIINYFILKKFVFRRLERGGD